MHCVLTGEGGGLAQRAVLVAEVGGAVLGGRGGGQDQLLLDQTGLRVVRGQLGQPLVQGAPEQVQTLRRLAQQTLSLRRERSLSHQRSLS